MPSTANNDFAQLLGLPALMSAAMHGHDLTAIGQQLQQSATAGNPAAMMDLAVLLQILGQPDTALALQAEALSLRNHYSFAPSRQRSQLRVLAIVAPGDLMTNTPLEFIAEGAGFSLELIYATDTLENLPEHDIAIIAISELDRNLRTLRTLKNTETQWSTPLLNLPSRIERLRRDAVPDLLHNCRGVCTPRTIAASRREMAELRQEDDISRLLSNGNWPLLVRPIDSHAGQGLSRISSPSELHDYLNQQSGEQFFITQYIDYRSAQDGQFRKYRVMMIDGQPYLAHMGIFHDWMVHYDSAGMKESAAKRQEEAAVMQTFACNFAKKHADAFAQIHRRVGLEYFGIDCGETPNGELLIFEVCASLAIHAMDSAELFPYKQPQMASIFDAFSDMMYRHYVDNIDSQEVSDKPMVRRTEAEAY